MQRIGPSVIQTYHHTMMVKNHQQNATKYVLSAGILILLSLLASLLDRTVRIDIFVLLC